MTTTNKYQTFMVYTGLWMLTANSQLSSISKYKMLIRKLRNALRNCLACQECSRCSIKANYSKYCRIVYFLSSYIQCEDKRSHGLQMFRLQVFRLFQNSQNLALALPVIIAQLEPSQINPSKHIFHRSKDAILLNSTWGCT